MFTATVPQQQPKGQFCIMDASVRKQKKPCCVCRQMPNDKTSASDEMEGSEHQFGLTDVHQEQFQTENM